VRNPFQYGGIVGGESFCNRETERTDLRRAVENGEKLFVYSERRLGKTSLVRTVLDELPRTYVAAYVDLWATEDEPTFVTALARALATSMSSSGQRLLTVAKELFSSLRPTLQLDDTGQPTVTFGVDRDRDLQPVLEEVLTAPARILERDRRPVIVFDEFQRIAEYDSDMVERRLRSVIQHQTDVAYLFLGSRRHTIRSMFLDSDRPLYRSAGHYPLGPIAASHWVPFVRGKFRAGDRSIREELILEVHRRTQGHPFYTQHLCHVLWERCEPGSEVTPDLVEDAVELLLQRESFAYSTLWESLTNNQRRFLAGLAAEGEGVKPFAGSFVRRYRLSSASNAQRAADTLLKRDVIDRDNGSFLFLDRFFRLWVERLPR
jgi:AAA+ ATPase superfamily predicted ATPase